MMTPEQQYRTEMLRTAMNAIFQHLQAETQLSEVEVQVTRSLCNEIEQCTAGSTDYDTRTWHEAAVATEILLSDRTDRTEVEFIAAYASVPPMQLAGNE
jgi:hypothetical protein